MKELSFEKAMEELEKIVAKLEEGGLALNESLSLFERGVKLARFLREELEKAEKKVEILLKDEKGEMKKEPFQIREEEESTPEEENDNNPNDNEELPF